MNKKIAASCIALALVLTGLSLLYAQTVNNGEPAVHQSVAGYGYSHISTATNTQISAKAGAMHTIVINTSVASTITVVDTSAANCSGGNNIAIFAASAPVGAYLYDIQFSNGLCITTAGASDLTVSFRN